MPVKLTAEDIQQSVTTALSTVPSGDNSKSGGREFAWERFRSSSAQAVLADPDILLYLKLRKMRSLVRPLAEVHGLLCTAIMYTEYTVRPDDVGAPDTPVDTTQVEAALTTGTVPNLRALRTATAAAFKDEVKREVRQGHANLSNVGLLLPSILSDITRRARDLYKICVAAKRTIPDLRPILLVTAAAPVRDRAMVALTEREGLDRVLALSGAVGALELLDSPPAELQLAAQHKESSKLMVSAMRALAGVLETRKVASSRAEAAREIAFYGKLASQFAPLTSEATRAFGLLSLDTPEESSLIEDLREVPVEAEAATQAAALQMLSSCAAEGFDTALRQLEVGSPLTLSNSGFLSATRVGAIAEVTGDITYRSG